METRRLLTMEEAAARLNVKKRYIRQLIAAERIDVIKVGRLVRIPEEAIEELMAAGYKPATNGSAR